MGKGPFPGTQSRDKGRRRAGAQGRQGGDIIEAELVDADDDTSGLLAVFDAGDAAGFVHRWAREAGKRAFARQTGLSLKTAERAALGRRLRTATLNRALRALRVPVEGTKRCALPGCDAWVWNGRAFYCCPRHQATARKRRQRARARTRERE